MKDTKDRAKRPVAPEEFPHFKPKKDAGLFQVGKYVFLYGPIRLKPALKRDAKKLALVDIVTPVVPPRAPITKRALQFATTKAAQRFFDTAFVRDDGPSPYFSDGDASVLFQSQKLSESFAAALEKGAKRAK